jgi:hypothetical protein
MTRLAFPQDRTAFVYQGANAPILTPPRTGLTVYLDQGKTALADIQTLTGSTIPASTIYTDQGMLPEFLGPDGATRLWVATPTSAASPVDAQIASLLEETGVGGDVSKVRATAIAAVNLSGHRVVTQRADGKLEYASNDSLSYLASPLWITTGSTVTGALAEALMYGTLIEPTWSWTPGPVYLGINGALTQTPPAAPGALFLAQVGVATSATAVFVDRSPSIKLS